MFESLILIVGVCLFNNIINFLREQHMNIQVDYHPYHSQQLSLFGESEVNYQNEIDLLLDKQPTGICSRISNSVFEMEEILNNFAYQCPVSTDIPSMGENVSLQSQKLEDHENTSYSHSCKKQKKIQKPTNSPFHNYQKHLNNALKKLVIIPQFEEDDQLYKQAAIQIWDAYSRGQVKTKRILHFVFNQKNEHIINDPELKTYGLWSIYRRYSEEVISQAKTYLSKLAIDQIDQQNIEGYLKTRKLKSKEGFKEYIVGFKSQLEGGYLKRRIIGQKILD